MLRKTALPVLEKQPGEKIPSEKKTGIHCFNGDNRFDKLAEDINRRLAEGSSVILLVPEIPLIDQILMRVTCRGPVLVLDKKTTQKKECERWLAIFSHPSCIVVGTRSAVFAPVNHLSLIVIVDDDNPSYKQEQSPYYHARKVAEFRSAQTGCDLFYVGNVPSPEVWAAFNKKAETLSFKNEVQIVDMNNYNLQKMSVLSVPLLG